jgi:hypothetical protein
MQRRRSTRLNPPPNILTREQCQRIRQNPTQHPVTGAVLDDYDANVLLHQCSLLFPIRGTVFNGVQLTNQEVAATLHEYGMIMGRNSFATLRTPFIHNTTDHFGFIMHTTNVYPAQWRDYYIEAGKQLQPLPAYKEPEAFTAPEYDPERYDSRSIQPDEVVTMECKNAFGQLFPQHKREKNRLIRICNNYMTTCDLKDIQDIHIYLQKKSYGVATTTALHLEDSRFPFTYVFNTRQQHVFLQDIDNLIVTAHGQDGIGSGVVRDFIQSCVDQVKNSALFVPVYRGSSRYVLNPSITLQEVRKMGYAVRTRADVATLYRAIGALFAFCARYDLPVPITLARGVCARILYKESAITPEMNMFYYMMDGDPAITNSMKSLLQYSPQELKAVEIRMNDLARIADTNTHVTSDNVVRYVTEMSVHTLVRSDYLGAFIDGFFITKHLRYKRVNIRQLERLVFGERIQMDSIRAWLAKPTSIQYIAETANEQKVATWFHEILYEETSDEEWFMRLIQFWTGYQKIDMEATHQVKFERDDGLPTSHTCFRQLCLPRNVGSKDELRRRMQTALDNVERGIGLRG